MKIIQKILAIAIITAMVCASLVIGLPKVTVSAEDSSSQFALLMDGYPNDEEDQSMGSHNTQSPVSPIGTSYRAQTFKPGVSGALTQVSLILWNQAAPEIDLYIGIWDTIGGDPSSEICSDIILGVVQPDVADWVDLEISSEPDLTGGTQYAIVIQTITNTGAWKRYSGSDLYLDGVALSSTNGGATWDPVTTDFAFKTHMSHSGTGLRKVAWHESGEYALSVNGVDDSVYKFDRQSSAWSLLGNPNPNAIFNDITYDPDWNEFYLAGEEFASALPIVYTYDGIFVNLGTPGTNGEFHAVTAVGGDSAYKFLAVGERTGGWGYAAWFRDGFGWLEVSTGWSGITTETLYDVTWNQQIGAPNNCYGVGQDGNIHGFVFRFPLGTTTASKIYNLDSDGNDLEPQKSIAWNPGYAQGAEHDYALIGANMFMGYGCVLKFDGSSAPSTISDVTDTIYDIAWQPSGERAILVGEETGGGWGVVYYHPAGTEEMLQQDMEMPPIYGVAFKGYTSPSSAIMVSSGGSVAAYPSATDIGTTITVNSAFPHSFGIDMWKTSDAGRASKLNTQVNVETTYTFMTEVNYTVSGVDQFYADGEQDIWVLLTAWYDDGFTPSPDPDDTDYNRTKNFQAIWQEGASIGADTAGMVYPGGSPGIDEVQFVSAGIEVGPGDHYYVYINLTLGPQLWAGDGQGFGNGPAPDINDGATAFNDPDSWDFVMTIVDINYMDAVNSSFEEFGLFRFTNITVSGNPSGNAPPGSVGNALGTSQINVSSNIPYYVNVSIPRLNMTTDNTKFIPASSVNVSLTSAFANNTNTQMNGSWGAFGRAFPGANQQLGVWGNASLAQSFWTVPAPLNSTTAHGPQGGDFQGLGDTFVQWYINVPGATAEGTYQASITFRVGYY